MIESYTMMHLITNDLEEHNSWVFVYVKPVAQSFLSFAINLTHLIKKKVKKSVYHSVRKVNTPVRKQKHYKK